MKLDIQIGMKWCGVYLKGRERERQEEGEKERRTHIHREGETVKLNARERTVGFIEHLGE